MKTQSDIEKSISQMFFSLQNKVTSYAKTSTTRAIVVAVSALIADLWNEIVQIKRSLFWSTATGSDLDVRGQEIGIKGYGAINLSTILVFSSSEIVNSNSTSVGLNFLSDTPQNWATNAYAGWKLYDSAGNIFTVISNTSNTLTISGTPVAGLYYIFSVVPEGSGILSNTSGVKYLTTKEVIVGLSNPVLLGKTKSVALGNRTIATCAVLGNEGMVQVDELTVFETTIPGVTAVTNPIPSQPRTGADVESDDAFRKRATTLIATLDIGTQAFFESLAVRGNAKVLRSLARKISLTDGTRVYIVTRSGEELTNLELTNLAIYIYDRSRAFDTIECVNITMTDIFINYECTLPPDIVLKDYYRDIANVLSDYFDFSKWDPDASVIDDSILVLIKSANLNVDINLDTFSVEGSKNGSFIASKRIAITDSLPRFARLKIKNTILGETFDSVLSSYPISQQNDPLLNPHSFQ